MNNRLGRIQGHEVLADKPLERALRQIRLWWEMEFEGSPGGGIESLPFINYGIDLLLEEHPRHAQAGQLLTVQHAIRELDHRMHATYGLKEPGAVEAAVLLAPWVSPLGRVETALVAVGNEEDSRGITAVKIDPLGLDESGWYPPDEELGLAVATWLVTCAGVFAKLWERQPGHESRKCKDDA